ncbi:hypothetical protein FSARC_10533 [Fusarium sarcochroum]|uniref:Ankyrin repeat protein n=1 Tax=Fusarium sarcochroum TaxID=1208366 RepID=A0A8H4X3N8_9HYPO|nr:hypothetical protein FSARC_10533 [Fusarium sarcochroum]
MEAIAGVIAVAQAVVGTCKAIDGSLTAIKGAHETLQRWTITSQTLRTTYKQFEVVLEHRKTTHLPGEASTYYRDIAAQLHLFNQELKKLEENVASANFSALDSNTPQSLKDKVRLAFRIHRAKDDQLFEWIDRHIRVLSTNVDLVKAFNDVNIDNIQRALGEGLAESDEEPKPEGEPKDESKDWRASAANLAKQVALRNLPPLKAETLEATETEWDIITIDQESLTTIDTVSLSERECRFRAMVQYVDQLEAEKIYVIASNVQLEAIRLLDEWNEARKHTPSFKESFPLQERYVNLLLSSTATHTIFGTRARKYVDHQIIPGLDTQDSDLRHIWLSVGRMYHTMKAWPPAKGFLRLALFSGYIKCESESRHSKIEDISKMVCQIYEEEGHPENAVALRQELKRRVGYDPTVAPEPLQRTYEWCDGKGFQVQIEGDQLVFIDQKNERGNTALHEAALDTKVDSMIMPNLMIDNMHVIENASGDTALLLAIDTSNEAVVGSLLRNPLLVHVRDREGGTPLHRCRNHRILGLVLEAINKPRHRPSLIHGGPNSVDASFLININSTDGCGRTALFVMCEKGHLKMMKQLLEAGADVRKPDILKRSPMLACLSSNAERGKREEMVLRLLEKNADPDEQDVHGNTARSALRRTFSSKKKIKQFLEQDPKAAFLAMEKGSTPGRRESGSTASTAVSVFPNLGLFNWEIRGWRSTS